MAVLGTPSIVYENTKGAVPTPVKVIIGSGESSLQTVRLCEMVAVGKGIIVTISADATLSQKGAAFSVITTE